MTCFPQNPVNRSFSASVSTTTGPMPTLSEQYPAWKVAKPFLVGGLAGCGATTIIQPIGTYTRRCRCVVDGGFALIPIFRFCAISLSCA